MILKVLIFWKTIKYSRKMLFVRAFHGQKFKIEQLYFPIIDGNCGAHYFSCERPFIDVLFATQKTNVADFLV